MNSGRVQLQYVTETLLTVLVTQFVHEVLLTV